MNAVVARITLRALFGRKRVLLLLVLPIILLGLAAAFRAGNGTKTDILLDHFGITALLPLVALIVGTGVLGAELDDGTAVYLLATPISRRTIVSTKFVVAAAVTVVFTAIPEWLAGVIAFPGQSRLSIGYAAGAAVGAIVYAAIFLALSVMTRRAMAVGLIYVLVWEGLLASFVSGIGVLSVQQYTLSVARTAADAGAVVPAHVSIAVAIPLAVVVVALAGWLATDRLSGYRISGEAA
ncbi:MAG: ABC transporter permease subunit [Acidothermaceae bacterium]